MRQFLRSVVLVLLCISTVYAQTGYNAARTYTSNIVAADIGLQQSSHILYHQVAWIVTNAPASCTFTVDSSVDGVSWTAGGIIGSTTCTAASGTTAVTAANANFIRLNVTALTAASLLTLNYTGWAYNPVGAGGTIGAGVANQLAIYTGTNAIAGDANVTDASTFFTIGGTDVGLVLPVGSAAQPNIQATGSASNTGIALTTTANCMSSVGTVQTCLGPNGVGIGSTKMVGWTASNASASLDTAFSRDAAGVVDLGSGAATNTTGKLKASGYMSVGTKFTLSANACAATTLTGGATAGSVASGTTGSCTFTVTMGDTATAPNGWACDAHDITTVADLINVVTPVSATAASFSGTTASGDVIQFKCEGY